MNDRPGSGANGSNTAQATELKSELARTKEALTAREQETGELKSRVKELEDTKSKSDRLITLKDSEIADLQKKLKDLQDQGSKNGSKATASTTPPAATTPPSATATTPPAAAKSDTKVSKEDIWGNNAPATGESKTPPAATTTPPPTGTGTTASSTTPATTPSATPPANTAATGSASGSSTSTGGTATAQPSTTPPSTAASTTPPTGTTPSTTPPSGTTTASTPPPPASSTVATPAKPAATTTPVKTAKTTTQPLPPNTPPWYEAAWVKPAAIGAAALLLLSGLLSMRRRKAAAAATERGSIAGAFGDTPLREGGGEAAFAGDGEEQALRDQLDHDPSNLGLHLELLSLLYAERHVGAFEDAAEAMHLHVTDPHQPEWLEAKAMGQELAPHNALFSDGAAATSPFDDEAVTARHATATPFDEDEDIFAPRHDAVPAFDDSLAPHHEPVAPPPATHAASAFDFDLDAPAPKPASATATEPPFAFDNLPPIDFGKEAEHEFEAAAPAAPLHVDEDEFAGEDGVGTKLDLAKAYLDMGDPEGARSMLEEVLSEGNDSQKGEARRLMAEIR
jgi:pilus assembly protein FimV